jgi:hypothetical protein
MNKIFYKNLLRTKEIGAFTFSLLSIVEKHDPELIGVKVYFDELNDLVPQLRLFTDSSPRSEYSDLINTDRIRVKQLCLAIISQVRVVKKGDMTAHRDAIFLLNPLITKNLVIAKTAKWRVSSADIEKFLLEVQASELLINACKTIGIDLFIAELSAVKLRHDDNCNARAHIQGVRVEFDKQALRKVIFKKVSNLLTAIDLAPVSNKTYDFMPLVIDLNTVITDFNAIVRSRKTRKLNKVIKKESAALTTKSVATETFAEGA